MHAMLSLQAWVRAERDAAEAAAEWITAEDKAGTADATLGNTRRPEACLQSASANSTKKQGKQPFPATR